MAALQNWEAVKATGGAVVGVVTSPLKILSKAAVYKFEALKALLGFKASAVHKIVAVAQEQLLPTTTKIPVLQELEQFVPSVFSKLHKAHFPSL